MKKNNYDLANKRIDFSIKCVKFAILCIKLVDVAIDFIVKHHELISMVFNYPSKEYDCLPKTLVT